MKNLFDNPKTSAIAFGAVVIFAACHLGYLSQPTCETAVLGLLAALGLVGKDA